MYPALVFKISLNSSYVFAVLMFSSLNFNAEMRGIPLRLEIGPKDIEKGQCVLAKRLDGTKETYALNEELPNTIHQLLDQIHDEMYAKALKFITWCFITRIYFNTKPSCF